jgi:hypothetical protein
MNTSNPILGASGRPMFQVGGEHAARTHTHGDYIVSLEWLNDGRESEPVMLIWSAHAGRDSGVFGICLSSIGKYADPSGSPTDECFFEAFEALGTLGRARLGIEVKKLVDTIMRFTPDLIMMPPAPMEVRRRDAGQALVEVTRKDENGRTIAEDVI